MRFIRLLPLAVALSISAAQEERPLPQFTGTTQAVWLNSPPLTTETLKGKVVLLEVWAFGCGNCQRSIPWLRAVRKKFPAETLAVIGIHTPEFDSEKSRANLEKNMRRFGIAYPVMTDNDYAYWNSLQNRYWPTFYLADKTGIIRGIYIGETHMGDSQAQAIERQIAELMSR
jgi:thiol-disulfide isomerase/thioredoxin